MIPRLFFRVAYRLAHEFAPSLRQPIVDVAKGKEHLTSKKILAGAFGMLTVGAIVSKYGASVAAIILGADPTAARQAPPAQPGIATSHPAAPASTHLQNLTFNPPNDKGLSR